MEISYFAVILYNNRIIGKILDRMFFSIYSLQIIFKGDFYGL